MVLSAHAPESTEDDRSTHVSNSSTLSSDFDVVYERPGADETVSMEFDNPDSGVSLGRANYPQSTGVVITIDDQALNVDPTSEDVNGFLPLMAETGFYEAIGRICRT